MNEIAVVLLAFGFIFLGIWKKIGIFHIFASGVFIYLAITFSANTALLIVFIGAALFELYFAFWGNQT